MVFNCKNCHYTLNVYLQWKVATLTGFPFLSMIAWWFFVYMHSCIMLGKFKEPDTAKFGSLR